MSEFKDLEKLYQDRGNRLVDIARHFGVSLSYLRKVIKERGLPARTASSPGAGRPAKLTNALIALTKKLSLLGLDDQRIWETLDISKATFYLWKSVTPKFLDAVGYGRALAAANVANKLYARTQGMRVTEERVVVVSGVAEVVKIRKIIPPDVRAQEIWLSRREPEIWRKTENVNVVDKTIRVEVPEQPPAEDAEDFSKMVEEQLVASDDE